MCTRPSHTDHQSTSAGITGGRGEGIPPARCGCQSPQLFVFLASPRGTVFVHGTAGAHISIFRCVIFVFSEREYAIVRLSVSVCLSVVSNVGAPYSVSWNFQQFFFAVWYLGHRIILRRSSQRNPSIGGLNAGRLAKYRDFWHLERCISETVQDGR